MKYEILLFLAFASSINAESARVLRGGPPEDHPGQGQGPPNETGPEPVLLTTINLSDYALVEFLELENQVVMSIATLDGESTSLEETSVMEQANPIKAFKKLQPGKKVPKKLKEAKEKVDKKKREEEENPTEYPEVPRAEDLELPEEAIDGGRERALSYSCPDGDSSYGTRCWWLFNYCEGGSINKNECACYHHITNDYGYWAYDDNMVSYVHPYRGSLGLAGYDWVCNGSCDWQYTGYSFWCPEGWTCRVRTWGAAKWRKAQTYFASDDGYNFSFYTNGGTPGVSVSRSCSTTLINCTYMANIIIFPYTIPMQLTVICRPLPKH